MKHFVIVYNRKSGKAEYKEFETIQEATGHRQLLERELNNSDLEIVALSSRSLEDLKKTHSRYFLSEQMKKAPKFTKTA